MCPLPCLSHMHVSCSQAVQIIKDEQVLQTRAVLKQQSFTLQIRACH